jgi:hypothetical protein
MAERPAPPDADLAAVMAITARAALSQTATAIRYLYARHRLERGCSLPDHLAAHGREADREADAQVDVMVEVVNAVLDDLALPEASRARALEIIVTRMRRHAAESEA